MGVPKSTVQKSWISNPAVSTVHMSVKLCWWRQFTGDTVHEEGLDQVGPWSGPLRVITQRIIEDNTPMSVCIYVHMIWMSVCVCIYCVPVHVGVRIHCGRKKPLNPAELMILRSMPMIWLSDRYVQHVDEQWHSKTETGRPDNQTSSEIKNNRCYRDIGDQVQFMKNSLYKKKKKVSILCKE